MDIVFIGAGNVATNLSKIFIKGGHKIIQIISKHASSASRLAREIGSKFSDDIKDINHSVDLYFLCVTDHVIEQIIHEMPEIDGLVIHTSGSTSINVFQNKFKNYGVFYPFQTFSKFKNVNLSQIPIFIEANTKHNLEKLEEFSKQISNTVQIIDSEKRLAIHLCGIFASNFTNHMYSITYHLAKTYNISFDLFFPLIEETAEKIKHRSPLAAQTGPAVRKNKNILEKHRDLLSSNPDLLNIYNILSESIIKFSE